MTESGQGDEERRQNNINLEHRLTKNEEAIKHYDKAQETIVTGISGLHKRFTDLKSSLCKKVDDTEAQSEKNKKSIEWIKGRPRRIFTMCLEVLGGVGLISSISYAIFRMAQ